MIREDLQQNLRLFIGWMMVLILPCWVMSSDFFYSLCFGPLAFQARIFMAVLFSSLSLWTFRLVPSFVGGVFIILSLVTFGLVPEKVALSGFGSPSFLMALSLMVIGVGLQQAELAERLYVILSKVSVKPWWRRLSVLWVGLLLTMFIPTMPGSGVRMRMLRKLLDYMAKTTRSQHYWTLLQVFQGSHVFSPIFLSGSTLNFVLTSFLSPEDQSRFQWIFWLKSMIVYGLLMLLGHLVLGWITSKFLKKEKEELVEKVCDVSSPVMQSNDKMTLLCVFLFCLGIFTVESHQILHVWISLLTLFLLLMLRAISLEEFRKKTSWDELVFLGGISGMLAAIDYLKITDFLFEKLKWLCATMIDQSSLFFWSSMLLVWALRLFLSQGIITIVLGAVFVPIAAENGLNVWCTLMLIMVSAQTWFFPISKFRVSLAKRRDE